MEFVIQEVGADRVMIGSDYCYDMGYDRPLEFLEQINLTSAERKMIVGENASRIAEIVRDDTGFYSLGISAPSPITVIHFLTSHLVTTPLFT